MLRSLLSAADGVVGIDAVFQNAFLEEIPFWTTPSAPLKEASRLLLDVASTPPMSGGVWHAQLIHTFFDPADITWTRSFQKRGGCAINKRSRSLQRSRSIMRRSQTNPARALFSPTSFFRIVIPPN